MNQDLFGRYSFLYSKKAAIEAELKELNQQILLQMTDIDSVDLKNGKFTKVKRKTYQYTEATSIMEAKIKEHKKLEEQSGLATFTESEYLRFTPAK